jgi:LmbE family N-acetylglucosaminyl deacetylase
MPQANLLAGKTILAVFAHPDDESLTCAGTLALCAQRGARVILASMTRGERAGDGSQSEELGVKREHELRAAAAALGADEVVIRDHPEGGLPWVEAKTLFRDIETLVTERKPDAVITFGQDCLCWHHDHIVVHEFVLAVTARAASPPAVYCATIPAHLARSIIAKLDAGGETCAREQPFGIDADSFGIHALPPSLVVDVRSVIARKLIAIRCHRTQVMAGSFLALLDDDEAAALLGSEYFHRPTGRNEDPALIEHALPVRDDSSAASSI